MNNLKPGTTRSGAFREMVARLENFTHRIVHSAAIRAELRHRQNNLCAYCNTSVALAEEHVHHVSYLHLCYTSESVDGIPPCTGCGRIEKCLLRLRIVHGKCHELIHQQDEDAMENINDPSAIVASIDKVKAKYPRNRTPWNSDDDLKLQELLRAGKKITSIRLALGRSKRAILLRMEHLGLTPDKPR